MEVRFGSASRTAKLTASEIKCYGRYMIPPLLVFGVLAIGAGLLAVSIRRGWIQ